MCMSDNRYYGCRQCRDVCVGEKHEMVHCPNYNPNITAYRRQGHCGTLQVSNQKFLSSSKICDYCRGLVRGDTGGR